MVPVSGLLVLFVCVPRGTSDPVVPETRGATPTVTHTEGGRRHKTQMFREVTYDPRIWSAGEHRSYMVV